MECELGTSVECSAVFESNIQDVCKILRCSIQPRPRVDVYSLHRNMVYLHGYIYYFNDVACGTLVAVSALVD